MYEVSKCAPQEALRNLDRAFDNFFRKCDDKKKGKFRGKAGFPRFKSKRNGIGSFRLTGTIKVEDKSIQLPRLGCLRLKETDYLPTKDAKILSATVREHAGRWFVSVQVEQDLPKPIIQKDDHPVIGVDLGIKTLATCSDGQKFENPKPLRRYLRKLKRLSRALSRKKKGGQNRKEAARKLAKLHYRISCIRKDTLNKITTQLTKAKSVVVLENLNVSGMLRNHRLAQAISDLGLFEFKRQMEYKGEWNGCLVKKADRFYPSSKACNVCGRVNENLTLSDREWDCSCGAHHDRDFNASVNLEKLGIDFTESRDKMVAVSSPETLNACEGRGPLVLAKA
jgi:putative transposase